MYLIMIKHLWIKELVIIGFHPWVFCASIWIKLESVTCISISAWLQNNTLLPLFLIKYHFMINHPFFFCLRVMIVHNLAWFVEIRCLVKVYWNHLFVWSPFIYFLTWCTFYASIFLFLCQKLIIAILNLHYKIWMANVELHVFPNSF